MKLKYILKKSLNIKNSYVIVVLLFMILIIGGYFSYALFTTYSESKGALNIVTGNLYSMIESSDLNSNKSITITPGDTKIVKLKLSNVNSISAKVNLYYTTTSNNIEIGYLSSGDAAPTNTGYVLNSYNESGSSKKIYVKITNNDEADVTVTFGSDIGLSTAALAFPTGKNILNRTEGTIKNNNILVAYTYQEDTAQEGFCITGEEKTCVVTNCIDDTTSDACPAGTVIKYHVNDTTDLFFNVLHDKDGVLTMQQRENTIRNIPWHENENKNSNGPDTILPQLEQATSTWTNVNEIEYTPGETALYQNAFTGCTWSGGASGTYLTSCGTNTYTSSVLGTRKARSRMITVLEASATGCLVWKNGATYTNIMGNSINANNDGSCPDFMHNYLYQSASSGGSYNNNTTNEAGTYDYGYWMMSAHSGDSVTAWYVDHYGFLSVSYTSGTNNGARAVVEIYKKI